MTVPRAADYTDAHRRHWKDAELLFGQGRWANADHLYGFSAECGLKAVMKSLGMPVDTDGTPQKREHRKHVQDLWPEFGSFAQNRNGAKYVTLLLQPNPFANWSHHDRYAHRRHFCRANVQPYRDGAKRVCDMVASAKQDGLLR